MPNGKLPLIKVSRARSLVAALVKDYHQAFCRPLPKIFELEKEKECRITIGDALRAMKATKAQQIIVETAAAHQSA